MALSGSFSGAIRDGKYTLRVDWSATQSAAGNTSTITCKHYLVVAANYWVDIGGRSNATAIDGSSLAWSSPAVDCAGGAVYLGAVSRTVSHSADGSKSLAVSAAFNIQMTAGGTYWPSIAASAYITLDTIPRASSISMPAAITLGQSVALTIHRASSAFTHRLRYHFGSQQAYFAENAGASASWSVPLSLAYEIPNAAAGIGRVYCETFSGSTLIGTDSVGFTASVPGDMVPSLAYTLSETGSALPGLYVQGRSRLKVQLTCVGAYGSAPASYSIQANGATYAASSATTAALTQAGVNTITMRATDSRGRTATRTATISVRAYREPWIDAFTAVRCDSAGNPDSQGGYVKCTVSGGLTGLPGNSRALALQIRRGDNGQQTRLDLPLDADAFTRTALTPDIDPDHSYVFTATLKDAFATTAREVSVSTAAVTLDIRASGRGVAFGKAAEYDNALEVAPDWQVRLYGKPFRPYTAVSIPANADLNDYTEPGDYYCETNAAAGTLGNMPPVAQAFWMEVRHIGGIVQQRMYFYDSQRIAIRGKPNWGDMAWWVWRRYNAQRQGLEMLSLPLSSLVAGADGSCGYWRSADGWVYVNFGVYLKSAPSSMASFVIATMPAGYRPKGYAFNVATQCANGGQQSAKVCALFERPNGDIAITPNNTVDTYFYGSLSYPADW